MVKNEDGKQLSGGVRGKATLKVSAGEINDFLPHLLFLEKLPAGFGCLLDALN